MSGALKIHENRTKGIHGIGANTIATGADIATHEALASPHAPATSIGGKVLPNGVIVGTTDTQTITNKELSDSNNYRIKDSNLNFRSTNDPTAQVNLLLDLIPTGTTRQLRPPNANGIIEITTNKDIANGYAGLDGSQKVIKDPANATATPTASKIPIADGSAKVDGWVSGDKHNTGLDTALGVLATKNPPIDADKAIYRNSAASDGLVTSTWAQIKAFLNNTVSSAYLLLTGGTLTGNLTISKVTPIVTLTDTGDDKSLILNRTNVAGECTISSNGIAKPSSFSQCAIGTGTLSYITVAHNLALDPSAFTIIVLVKLSDTGAYRGIIDKFTSASGQGGWLIDYHSSVLRCSVGTGTTFYTATKAQTADGGWHQVILSFAGNGNVVNIYVDGVIGSPSAAATFASSGDSLKFFGDGATTNYLNGSIDEAIIFNYAFNQTQVTAEYNAGAWVYHTAGETGLVAGWHFEGNSNSYGGAYNGTDTNVTYGAGAITIPSQDVIRNLISFEDGTLIGEGGKLYIGDKTNPDHSTYIRGNVKQIGEDSPATNEVPVFDGTKIIHQKITTSQIDAAAGIVAGQIASNTITNTQINSAAGIADTKLATISTAGKVDGGAINSSPIPTLVVSGYSTLGTGGPTIKTKNVSGTTSSSEGGTSSVAHGIDSAKIICLTVLVEYTTGAYIPLHYVNAAGYSYEWYSDNTNVTVINHATSSENILSKPIRIFIVYTA